MMFPPRAHSDESALPKSNLGRLHQERACILGNLSCAVARVEDIELQLNDIKCKLMVVEDGDETCSQKILKKRIRTLKFQLTQCRKTEDALAANFNIVTEQIQYVTQHRWNDSQRSYTQCPYPNSPQMYSEGSPVLSSPFVTFSPSFPLVTSPISYDQGTQSFSLTPVITSPINPSSACSTWSQWTESDTSNISDPNSPRMDLRGMPHYRMQFPRTPSSDSSSPPSPYYMDYSTGSPFIWQNWSFGPSTQSHPPTPIDLISPMTNLNIANGNNWSLRPFFLPLQIVSRVPTYYPDLVPISNPKPTLKRSKFQFHNFPLQDNYSNNTSTKNSNATSSGSKFKWGRNDSTIQSTSSSTLISVPASIPGGQAIILNPAPLPRTRISPLVTATQAISTSEEQSHTSVDVNVDADIHVEAKALSTNAEEQSPPSRMNSRKRSLSQVYNIQMNESEEELLRHDCEGDGEVSKDRGKDRGKVKEVHRSRSRSC